MVRFNSFPSGTLNVAVYTYEPERSYFYEAETLQELEDAMVKDWKHLISTLGSMPLPPGFPRP